MSRPPDEFDQGDELPLELPPAPPTADNLRRIELTEQCRGFTSRHTTEQNTAWDAWKREYRTGHDGRSFHVSIDGLQQALRWLDATASRKDTPDAD